MNYQDRILKRVDTIILQNPGLKPLHDLFQEYLTTDNIRSMSFGSKLTDILRIAGVTETHPAYERVISAAEEADLYGSKSVRSPQEYALIQSPRGEEGISPTKEPYRIMALDMTANLEDVQEARKRIGLSSHGSYFGLPVDFIRISVEDIDSEGRTTRDPVPLREDGTPMDPSAYTYASNFPFRRK
ncbi:MAG: hypothetical protein HYT72_01785 [Candidatus Aenigmarchaeota archaeon]|nr:hypothetical protein [Candidatus Aenigmarchaeota archaeon]